MNRIITLIVLLSIVAVGCVPKNTAENSRKPNMILEKGMAKVFSFDGRFYVVGKEDTAEKFQHSPHLPYTRTLLGAGPQGETVIFEVDKKNQALAEELQELYESTPWEISSNGKDYFTYKLHGRIYVIGQKETRKSFVANGHLPYTRTLLGAGPAGETVIFEVDKKDPELAKRLEKAFQKAKFFGATVV